MDNTFILLVVCLVIISFYYKYNNSEKVYYPPENYNKMNILQKHWNIIANEYKALPKDKIINFQSRKKDDWYNGGELDEIANKHFQDYGWHSAWSEDDNVPNNDWKNWGLMYKDVALGKNAELCPLTTAMLNTIPGIRIAGFSLMTPNSVIDPHTDTTGIKYGSLAYHLGIDVPDKDSCFLIVNGEKKSEENGKVIIFDSTYIHSAYNITDKERCILYIDFQIE